MELINHQSTRGASRFATRGFRKIGSALPINVEDQEGGFRRARSAVRARVTGAIFSGTALIAVPAGMRNHRRTPLINYRGQFARGIIAR
jgi:hypothetical protein